MPLVAHGAFNPIGCLRIDTAVDFFRDLAAKNPDTAAVDGFTLEDVTSRSEPFLEHLSLHAMLAAGTTGVQGVAPKFLLARNAEGRWFADLALDDALAREHWLVKLPRGRTPEDVAVLRNEAAYLRVAAACGLRVHADAMHVGDMLFVRRFDRLVDDAGLHRLHQESLASLAGLKGFGGAPSQNELVAAFRRHVDDPLGETVEFVKRDVLNLALRNTDNHARNTAVQRLPDGRVRLTPLFDFAPMFADPDVVPRSVHWRDAEGRRVDEWAQVVSGLDVPDGERSVIARELRAFAETVGRLPEIARDCGVDVEILERCRAAIDRQAEALAAMPGVSARG
jgi:serine/threonine-protein kinase HipA